MPLLMPDFDQFVNVIRETCAPRFILDVGAGDFADSERLAMEFPGATVVGIEPGCDLDVPPMPVRVDAVVWEREEELPFYDYGVLGLASLCRRPNVDLVSVRTVYCKTIDSIANGYAPDVIKIDVEGCALQALRGAPRVLDDCKVVHVETEKAGTLFGNDEKVCELMRDRGFRQAYRYDSNLQWDTAWVR